MSVATAVGEALAIPFCVVKLKKARLALAGACMLAASAASAGPVPSSDLVELIDANGAVVFSESFAEGAEGGRISRTFSGVQALGAQTIYLLEPGGSGDVSDVFQFTAFNSFDFFSDSEAPLLNLANGCPTLENPGPNPLNLVWGAAGNGGRVSEPICVVETGGPQTFSHFGAFTIRITSDAEVPEPATLALLGLGLAGLAVTRRRKLN